MQTTRYTLLAAASLAFAQPAGAGEKAPFAVPASTTPGADALAHLVRLSEAGNAALMHGDAVGYFNLVPLSRDFVLMSPFGGTPSRSGSYTLEETAAIGRFFRNGTFTQEIVESYVSDDMVVLATIERAYVEVGGLPAQEWALRVTLVNRRDEDGWKLVHRHADPLANPVSVEQAAALGRGSPAP
jgi:ketosteroid isomerase-like protein